MPKLKKLGEVAVDSGQVIVVDPCYLAQWTDGDFDPEGKGKPRNSYEAASRLTCSPEQGGEMVVAGRGGTGVVTTSGYGDGCYPAYVMVGDDALTGGWGDRHVALIVLFDGSASVVGELARLLDNFVVDPPEGEE